MYFASDNSGPAAPQVMQALLDANSGYQSSYGADDIMDRVRDRIREIFEAPDAAVYLVATGTAANSLALATITQPWSAIYCHKLSHIEEDECNAPEFFTSGAKLHLIDGADAKIDPKELEAVLETSTDSFVHNAQRGALSITNVTERGAVYSVADVAELCALAKSYNLPVHMDGARFANALVSTNASAAEMTWRAGVDVLSFGGTKNGLLGVEAVVFFDPKHAWEFELRRKRAGHLFSKHRYLSAQMEAYLADDLWLTLARQANAAADRLRSGLGRVGGQLMYGQGANMVYAGLTRAQHRVAQEAGVSYYSNGLEASPTGADDDMLECRLVTNWSTTGADVDQFIKILEI